MDGIINIYKEKGYTSHDVVAKLRGILKQKKIGHTGTLDPEAEGVLPVCLGKATKLCDLLTEKDKCYEAVLKLGISTDTQDLTGKIIKKMPVDLEEGQIRRAILSFIGDYEQIPPMYSALKVNGKKLYELAREGKEIVRQPRTVRIYDIEILDFDPDVYEVRMRIACSKGTYIRTLCQDIGDKLMVGGAMKSLLRTRVERFLVEESLTLSEAERLLKEKKLSSHIVCVEDMFLQYPSFIVKEEKDRFLYNGNPLSVEDGEFTGEYNQEEKKIKVFDSNCCFKGLYEFADDKSRIKPFKMFL